jgi:hypothetical protein
LDETCYTQLFSFNAKHSVWPWGARNKTEALGENTTNVEWTRNKTEALRENTTNVEWTRNKTEALREKYKKMLNGTGCKTGRWCR